MTGETEAAEVWDVAIVGAGPIGLLLAGELASHGVRVVVVERADSPPSAPKANGIVGHAAVELAKRGFLAGIGFPGHTSDETSRIARVRIPATVITHTGSDVEPRRCRPCR
jgi:2-polyprenyl-6-methoxyphenol hydroxylase-like FAD-dependent oxidoreductase